MKVESRVDRHVAAPQLSHDVDGEVDAAPLDAAPVVGDLEADGALDQRSEAIVHLVGLDARLFWAALGDSLHRFGRLDPLARDATVGAVEGRHPGE
jgi:hypothetical protein